MAHPGASHPGWRRITSGRPRLLLPAALSAVFGAWAAALLAGSIGLSVVNALAFWRMAIDAGPLLARWSSPLFALPHDAALALLGGPPVHLALAVLGLRRWPAYGLAGAAAGVVVAALLPASGMEGSPEWDLAASLANGAAPGSGGALTFWGVLRPDRI